MKIKEKIYRFFNNNAVNANIDKLKNDILYSRKSPKIISGKLLAEFNNQFKKDIKNLAEVEFQVFSQFGDDGIIQYLIHILDIPHKTFIEFGVENYTESNTRFLLINNYWSGIVIDGGKENIAYIDNDWISHYYGLHSICSFITKDNINILFKNLPFNKEVGILSVDIDGNDYYVWEAINTINPIIVIAEYNSLFGLNPWTIEYQADFVRSDYDMSCWGVSLQSLCDLGSEKGYSFIGCNSAGNNAYFVRNDKIKGLKPLTCEEGFVESQYREKRDSNGKRISGFDRNKTLNGMKIFNTRTKSTEIINFQ